MKSIEIINFNDPEDFVDYLRPSRNHWGDTVDLMWIFRGNGNADWKLIPRAWRPEGQSVLQVSHDSRYPGLKFRWEKIKSMLPAHYLKEYKEKNIFENILWNAAEFSAVYQFSELADELGYPLSSKKLIDPHDFIKNFPGPFGWPDFPSRKEFFFAQHHGMPTRFLDWTRKPLIAAYFAAEDGAKLLKKNKQPGRLCVWALDRDYIDYKYSQHYLVAESCERHQHSFLHAQDGLFLRYDKGNDYFLQKGSWPNFEDIIESSYESDNKAPLRKLTLPLEKAGDLLSLLHRERITRAHLMPTFDNISHTISLYWNNYYR